MEKTPDACVRQVFCVPLQYNLITLSNKVHNV